MESCFSYAFFQYFTYISSVIKLLYCSLFTFSDQYIFNIIFPPNAFNFSASLLERHIFSVANVTSLIAILCIINSVFYE